MSTDGLQAVEAAVETVPGAALKEFMDRLAALFQKMDAAYGRAAAAYGFRCRGCEDNCCTTRFYHHTVAEYLYIKDGFHRLDGETRRRLHGRARSVCRQAGRPGQRDAAVRPMCPVNADTRCILYAHRPMICRLHGIPHRFRTPAGTVVSAPGCDDFTRRCGSVDAAPLDRTPYYREMSILEQEIRHRLGVTVRLKLTIAEMLAHMTP